MRSLRRFIAPALCLTAALTLLTLAGCSTSRHLLFGNTLGDNRDSLELCESCDDSCDDSCRRDDVDPGEPLKYLKQTGSGIAYPCLDNETAAAVRQSAAPRTIGDRNDDEIRDITLGEVIYTALSRNDIVEGSAFGGVGTKAVLTNPDFAPSVYDVAIQETGILFGRRGLEAALADFDAQFGTSMIWGRTEQVPNTPMLGPGATPGATLSNETARFEAFITKAFASGGQATVFQNMNYNGSSAGTGLFPSAYTGSLGVNYRMPLLAGSGTEYTRIAGPQSPGLDAITGVSQGVVIARINNDITIADFELAVRDGVRDIQNAYWDLYFSYRQFDTAAIAHQSAFQTWREVQTRFELGAAKAADELQARDQLYETKAAVEQSLNTVFKTEAELRRLIGIPMNDGTVLRPADDPMLAEYVPDWRSSVTRGLMERTELRRQKWNIKSLQLQLGAARSLVRPRLDLTSSYALNGFGDRLYSGSQGDGITPRSYRSAVGTLAENDLTSWSVGLEYSMPIGFRRARSQARSIELQLAKANAVLSAQERGIAHDIASSIQDVTVAFRTAETNRKRLEAAERRVGLLETERDVGTLTLDLVLRAQRSRALAEQAYYESVTNYNKALIALKYSEGALLAESGIYLGEGQWSPAAYRDSLRRARDRTDACEHPNLLTEPAEFASPGNPGTVEL